MKPENLRILFWADASQQVTGGAEIWAQRYLSAMQRKGYRIQVIADRANSIMPCDEHRPPVPVHCIDAGNTIRGSDARAWLSCLKTAAAIESDFRPHVHHISTSLSVPTLLLFLMSRGLASGVSKPPMPKPVTLMSLHQEWRQFAAADSPHGRAVHEMDWVCCFSQSTRNFLLNQLPAQAPALACRSSVIPHAIPPRNRTHERVQREVNAAPTIAFIGRLSHEKGADLALRSFHLLRAAFPDARMIVAGAGLERDALVEMARQLGISDAVTFTGWLSEHQIRATLRTASLLLVPSREESFGMVALEAATEACPVIATAVGGLPEVCIDGVTGLLCPPEDPEALATAAARLLADPDLSMRLGLAAQARLQSLPGWEDHIAAHETLIQGLVAERFPDAVRQNSAATAWVTP